MAFFGVAGYVLIECVSSNLNVCFVSVEPFQRFSLMMWLDYVLIKRVSLNLNVSFVSVESF
jgi:hypothetical protein